jgi:CelD/BcsL family acetyltransferase involved in cellulose biosynthesis
MTGTAPSSPWSFVAAARGGAGTGPPALPEVREAWLLEHDPLWLSALLDDPSKDVLLAVRDGGCFCGLFVHDVGISLDLGQLSLGRIPVRRHVLTGGLPEKAASREELVALLTGLAGALPVRGVVFLQGVRDGEPLRAALDEPAVRAAYHVRRHGPPYQRCRIALTGSFDAYVAGLGRSTRKDLRRLVRSFRDEFGDSVEVQVLTRPAEIEAALPDLIALSAKTYQARLLGLGISRGNVLERQLRHGAKLGMARLDLLRVGGKAISFQIAYAHRETLYATQGGYDPEWKEWSPGIVHHHFFMEDLCRTSPELRLYDFMYGEGLYKTRLSNTFHAESHFYLFPRTARGRLTWLALEASDRLSRWAGAALGRVRGKAALTRLIHRLAERAGR